MKRTPLPRHLAPSRGIATVGVTMILALLTALAMIYLSRNAVFEQRMAANDQRERQAMAAASAGLDQALAFMDGGGDVRVAGAPGAPTSLLAGSYRVAYCSGDVDVNNIGCGATPAAPSCGVATPVESGRVTAVACGWSDDNTAVRKMSQVFASAPSLPNSLETPLVSKAGVNVSNGSVSVFNYDNDLTVWAGGTPTLGGGNPETYIRNKADPQPPLDLRTNAAPSTCGAVQGYVCSSTGASMGHDVIVGDTRLSAKSDIEFFQMFFNTTPDNYRDTIASYKIDLNDKLPTQQATTIEALAGLNTKEAVWLSGDADLKGMVVGGPGGNGNKEPIILIVDGNLSLGAGLEFNGLIFVLEAPAGQPKRTVTSDGSPKIFGSLISTPAATLNKGNLSIVFDSSIVKLLDDAGKVSRVPGSWRDW